MRILVTINQSQPELLIELSKLEPRHRAERIRALAFLGMKAHTSPIETCSTSQKKHKGSQAN